jgi:hypothetical protein
MIEVINFKLMPEGACKAKFTVKIVKMGMEIRDCGLFEAQGKKWIGMPSKPYEKDGMKKYFNFVSFTPEMKKRFDDQVFAELSKIWPKQQEFEQNNEVNDDLPF